MRKTNLLIGTLALGLGVILGVVGFAIALNPNSPTSIFYKLTGNANTNTNANATQTVASAVQPSDSTMPNTADANNLNQDLGTANSANDSSPANSTNNNPAVPAQLAQQIIADYKQDIGLFFDAWKSKDIATFKTTLAKAYAGDLFQKHAQRAEAFLNQGIGLDVSKITFNQVNVEQADSNTATLQADYNYVATDYNLTDSTPVGETHEQSVHVRANLVKIDSRWLITGETTLN